MKTVKDLIEYLQKLPQDSLLIYPEIDCNNGWKDREYWIVDKIEHRERVGFTYESDPKIPYSSRRVERKGIEIMLGM